MESTVASERNDDLQDAEHDDAFDVDGEIGDSENVEAASVEPHDGDDDDFGDLDLAELERGGKTVEKKEPQYQQYSGSGGRVVAREKYVKSAALGESATEGRILKTIIIIIALAVPALTIYWQMAPGDDAEDDRKDRQEQVEK